MPLTSPVTLGKVVGLVARKQLGITLFAWLAVKSEVSELLEGIGWRQVYGAGWLAGIVFTMSLIVSDLTFPDGPLVDAAKLGILVASLVVGLVGWTILRGASSPR
jgi:NhaA family Na+:H+ antiporter